MLDLTMKDIINADFRLSDKNPILTPFDGTFVCADPSLLTPDEAHDGRWHLFFHTNIAVYHFIGDDGINFTKAAKVVPDAMRPNINRIDGRYYLFYEHTRPVFENLMTFVGVLKWRSEICVIESDDLISWSEPKRVLSGANGFENDERGTAISNPFLLRENGKNRLYFSCGQTFIRDCGFCEPTYISYAESSEAASAYSPAEAPIISPDRNNPYLNLCSGCLKVYRVKDGYIGFQNGIFEKDGKSHSAIIMLSSEDGLHFHFERSVLEPQIAYGSKWMKQFVYASHLVRYGDTLRLYFNARDISNPLLGREGIGFCEARI